LRRAAASPAPAAALPIALPTTLSKCAESKSANGAAKHSNGGLAGWRRKLPDETKEKKVLWFFFQRKSIISK